jgi:hypothetical protein
VRRRALPALLFLFAACTRLPVTEVVTIEPSADHDSVTVSVSTSFWLSPPNEQLRERVEEARSAALSGTDAWSVRFGRLHAPLEERLTLEKTRGALERVTRAARIPSDDLQQLFSDTGVTVDVLRGEGWRELRLFPGSSGRATREQQKELEATLDVWSRSVTRYFTAMHHFYRYLDENPERAQVTWAAFLEERGADGLVPPVAEEEALLIDAVRHSMDEIATRMDVQNGQASILMEQADLVYNPFPGRIVIRVPRDVLMAEGFVQKGNELSIEPVDLFESLAGLEGRWISPDPLAASLRDQQVTSAQMTAAKRKSTAVVNSSEVSRAIREQLVRPKTYVVRWRE